ncbi:MAG: hypothetical protein EI684_20935, partial [Candidatus Viridilinea halotolerans]
MAHTKRISAKKGIAFQGSPGSGKTRQAIALFALFAHRYHQRHTEEFRGQPLPTWAYRLIRNWRNNPYTSDDAPKALPIAVSTPMRVTTTWQRELQGAYPESEVMFINTFRDVDAWMAQCATSNAPVVVGVFSQSKTRAFGVEWTPAVITKTKKSLVVVKSEEVALRAIPRHTAQGTIIWEHPNYLPIEIDSDDPRWESLKALVAREGYDAHALGISYAERVVSVGDVKFEVSQEQNGTLKLHRLADVTPMKHDEKIVGWLNTATGSIVTKWEDEPNFFCPDCGTLIEALPRGAELANAEKGKKAKNAEEGEEEEEDEQKKAVTSLTYFTKQPRRCACCGSPLWQKQRTKAGRTKFAMPSFAEWSKAIGILHAQGAFTTLGATSATRRIVRVEQNDEGEATV